MRVLSEEPEWRKEIACGECHARLEITREDLIAVNAPEGYGGDTFKPEIKVTCALCDSVITVTQQVSNAIRQQLFTELRKRILGTGT